MESTKGPSAFFTRAGNRVKTDWAVVLPYLAIIAVALFGMTTFFRDGIVQGDDLHCHLAQSYDVYYGLKHGFFLPDSNHLIFGSLGYNMIEAYAPLPHFLVGLFYFLFEWAGADVIISYKVINIVFYILGGIFFYHMMKRFTKRDRFALIAALIFIAYPYRSFHIICRASFSEAFALSFVPLFFDGLFALFEGEEKKDWGVKPYLKIGFAIATMFYCHLLTVLFAVTFALIYLLCRMNRVIRLFRHHKEIVKTGLTIFGGFLLCLPTLLPTLEVSTSGIYRVSNSVLFDTTRELLVAAVNRAYMFTGFRIFSISSGLKDGDSTSAVYMQVILFAIEAVVLCIADYVARTSKKEKVRRYAWAIDFGIVVMMTLLLPFRLEMLLAEVALFMLIIIIKQAPRLENKEDSGWFLIIFSFAMTLLTLLLIFAGWIWYIVPSVYLKAQFGFRFFSFFSFFGALGFGLLLTKLRIPHLGTTIACLAVATCLVFNQANFEKRQKPIAYTDWAPSDCYGMRDGGLQFEYLPQSIFDAPYKELQSKEPEYQSKYANSLLPQVRNIIKHRLFSNDIKDYLTPVALEGAISEVDVTYLNTPEVHFTLTVNEDALIQIPQIYYSGYRIEAKGTDTVYANVVNVDGLVSFRLGQGSYEVHVYYPGSVGKNVGRGLAFATMFSICVLPFALSRWIGKRNDEFARF